MKIQNRQQLLLVVAVAVIGLYVGDRLVLSPLIKGWNERVTKIATLRKSVSHGESLLERDDVIRRRWESMRTNTLPTEMSVAESRVLKAVDRWSQESRVSISSIKPQWKRSADDYMVLECRVDASGTLATIVRFLYEVEKDPVALKVEALELSSRDNEGQQQTLGLLVSGLLLNPVEP